MGTNEMSLLASLLFGAGHEPPPEKPNPERAEWQRRSDAYATVKPAVLAALTAHGPCTPQLIVKETGINLNSVRRALRRLRNDRIAQLIQPASRGQGKAPAVWAIVTDPPRVTDVPCPACGAGVGEWCMNNRKQRRRQTHQVRLNTYRASKEKHHAD